MFAETKYHEIYRNDAFIVFKGIKSKEDINNWLNMLQWRVDGMAHSDYLQFTNEVCGKDDDLNIQNEMLTCVINKIFPLS